MSSQEASNNKSLADLIVDYEKFAEELATAIASKNQQKKKEEAGA